jgi:hypothetical protein
MYLAKYFFPFGITFEFVVFAKDKKMNNKLKQNKNLS